jgi:hypothetical protein
MEPENAAAMGAMVGGYLDEKKAILAPYVNAGVWVVRAAFAPGAVWRIVSKGAAEIEASFGSSIDGHVPRLPEYNATEDSYELSVAFRAALRQLVPAGYEIDYNTYANTIRISCVYSPPPDDAMHATIKDYYNGRWIVGPIVQPLRILLVPSPLLPRPW